VSLNLGAEWHRDLGLVQEHSRRVLQETLDLGLRITAVRLSDVFVVSSPSFGFWISRLLRKIYSKTVRAIRLLAEFENSIQCGSP
jgi:hypothetical protein